MWEIMRAMANALPLDLEFKDYLLQQDCSTCQLFKHCDYDPDRGCSILS
jgi:hypothetical protein